jgi:hypothetical protein
MLLEIREGYARDEQFGRPRAVLCLEAVQCLKHPNRVSTVVPDERA